MSTHEEGFWHWYNHKNNPHFVFHQRKDLGTFPAPWCCTLAKSLILPEKPLCRVIRHTQVWTGTKLGQGEERGERKEPGGVPQTVLLKGDLLLKVKVGTEAWDRGELCIERVLEYIEKV